MIDLRMPLLCVSACLLGHEVRYDGGHKLQRRILRLPSRYALLAACPEAECGLGIPRELVELHGNPKSPKAIGILSQHDYAVRIKSWAITYVQASSMVDGFILKERSPSCGLRTRVRTPSGARLAPGIFASAIVKAHPLTPLISEEGFNDPASRESFLHSAEALSEWRSWGHSEPMRFHKRHLALATAHNPKLASTLCGLISKRRAYIDRLITCLGYAITEPKLHLASRILRKQGDTGHSLLAREYLCRFTKPAK